MTALALSLATPAYAAVQLARNSVDTRHLKERAVTGPKIDDGTVAVRDLAGRWLLTGKGIMDAWDGGLTCDLVTGTFIHDRATYWLGVAGVTAHGQAPVILTNVVALDSAATIGIRCTDIGITPGHEGHRSPCPMIRGAAVGCDERLTRSAGRRR